MKSLSVYNPTIGARHARYLGTSLIMVAMAWAFYRLQDQALLPGGEIAPAKLVWLAWALFFWFCLPGLLLRHPLLSTPYRTLLRIFLINMIVRGLVELYLMYGLKAWHPYYGIGHDLATVLGLLIALIGLPASVLLDRRVRVYLIAVSAMLCADAGFAAYLLAVLDGAGDSEIFFVPDNTDHSFILLLTTALNWGAAVLWLWMYRAYVDPES